MGTCRNIFLIDEHGWGYVGQSKEEFIKKLSEKYRVVDCDFSIIMVAIEKEYPGSFFLFCMENSIPFDYAYEITDTGNEIKLCDFKYYLKTMED